MIQFFKLTVGKGTDLFDTGDNSHSVNKRSATESPEGTDYDSIFSSLTLNGECERKIFSITSLGPISELHGCCLISKSKWLDPFTLSSTTANVGKLTSIQLYLGNKFGL